MSNIYAVFFRLSAMAIEIALKTNNPHEKSHGL